MRRHFRWAKRACQRTVVTVTTVVVATSVLTVINTPNAAAAGTILFENLFNDRTVDGTGTVTKPTPSSGSNVACLTATGNTSVLPLLSCTPTVDTQGNGTLRFTSATASQVGGVFGATSFPSSNGLDVTFNTYQYGGGGADGLGFVLAAVDPANPVPPAGIGPSGGSLGYTPAGALNGLTNAYLGVGLDVFGNFSNSGGGFTGTGCGTVTNITGAVPGAVVVRGPGNVKVGYCALTTTYDGTAGSKATLKALTRAAAVVPVEVLINPTASAFTSASGITVAAGTYKVVVTPVGQSTKTLAGTLPTVPTTLYPSTTWLSAGGIPKQLAFGFVGSTGGTTDVHEVGTVKVLTFNPVPQLAVSTTSYSAASTAAGGPVNYSAVASVLAGADENSAISVTQTLPSGAVPVGAYGSGWNCSAAVGQTISCTTTGTSFTNGTVLPAITIIGIVTAASMTASVVQNGSSTAAGSADANPGTDAVMTAGTVPAAPSGLSVSPAIGSIAGGGTVTISQTSTPAPTAVEIGTTAEQAAGTPVVLLPCVGAATVNCFNVVGGNVVIPAMPARASAAAVSITLVTLGVASAVGYVYADKPATPAAPTATAGATSTTVSWVAPAVNGSAITGYILTPYLNTVGQTAINYDASATTRTVTGLTAGGSYTYTIAATNAYGTSAASPKSVAVVPYTLPSAPAVSAVSAGDSAATLTWTAPASNGNSTITGYVVTPYIGAVAQSAQTFNTAALTQTVTGLTPGTAYTFTVAAINQAGTGPPSVKSSAVTPNVSPTITSSSPQAGEVGAAYSKQVVVTNGTPPFAWTIISGALPAGLSLSASTGLLSGTPTASGTFPITVQVTDGSSQTAAASYNLVIAAAPTLAFTPAAGEVAVAYSQQATVSGGTGPYTWAVSGGSLPAGLTINATTGLISGTPTASGSFSVTVAATDSFGQVAAATGVIVVAALPTFSASTPPAGQVGVAYSTSFGVTGGTAPLTWSVSAGSVPPGLTLAAATGVLSGTATTAGSYPFTVTVTDANGKSATKSVTVVVTGGPLVITKTANVSSTTVGSIVLYTITVANTSTSAFTGVAFTDPLTGVLDDAAYNANATASSGSVSYTSPNLSWSGNVAANATVTITYSVTVSNPDTGNKVLANTVTSSTLGNECVSGSLDTRCTATVTVAGLTIVKSADVSTTTPGSTVRYSIAVTNSGQTPYTGAAFTDSLAGVLDDATYNLDGVASTGSLTYASGSFTWTGDLAVGATSTITYSVTVANPDTGNRSLTGTIVSASAGSSCPSGNAAASCSATVTVLVPALVITNTTTVSTTTPGNVVPYTVTLSNTGQTAYTATTVTVALAAALDDASYGNNATASAGSVAYNSAANTLVWTGNLAVGAAVTIAASVTVNSPDPGDRILTTVASSAAAGSTCPAGSINSACTSTVQVLVPALTITKSADVSSTTPGSVVRYTIVATNTGQTAYTGATFTDPLVAVLDDAAYNTDAATTAGSVSFAGSTLTWTGNLAIAATATITYSVTVNKPDNGNKLLSNTVTSTTVGSNCASGGTDPRCTSSVTVLIPAISFSTAVGGSTTTPAGVVQYTVTVTNTGQTPYAGASVTLNPTAITDDATYNSDASTSTGSLTTKADSTLTWTLNLADGASATATFSYTVNNPDTGNQSLDLVVISDAVGSTCPTGSTNTACKTTVTVLTPGLLITKTAGGSTVVTGGTVNYTITVSNTGQTNYPAATFTDSLASVLTDASYAGGATASAGSISYAAPTLTWSGPLAMGATATIAYSVTIRDPDPGDKRITNTVVSTSAGSNCAAGSTDTRCTAAVNVLVPALTIVKSANASSTVPGAVVGYTITVTNSGATAYAAATFSDPLTTVTDDANYNSNVTATAGTATFAGNAVNWSGPLAIGASATITYAVTVHSADGGDNLLTNTVTSTSSGSNCSSGSADARCTTTVPVARLVVIEQATEATTTPGSIVHISETYTNTGRVAYTGISVASPRADTADDTVPNGDQTATSGTLVRTTAALTWSGNIPVGGTVTITRTLTVINPDTGNHIITATLQSTAPGNNCPSGTADARCTFSIAVLVPGLTVTKSANVSAVVPGGTVSYTITVQNTGQTPYTGAVVSDSLAGVLDDGTYNAGSATTTSGALSYSSPTLTWTGNLAVGATVTIAYTVTTFAPDPGDKTMTDTVTSGEVGSTCPASSGNAACRSTVLVLTPGLTIVKTANLTAANLGATVTYTVTVTNSGQTPFSAATFDDSLAGVTDDATYNSGGTTASVGTATYASGTLSWTGGLAVGQVATITYTVTVASPDTGNRSLTNTVISTSTGSNCSSGSMDTRCSATVPVTNSTTLTFNKTSDVTSTIAGGVVRYTASVTNSSTATISSLSFTDGLAGLLDDAIYNADAVASSGTVSFVSPNLTWTGTVAAGATVSVSYSVTVRNPLVGNNLLSDTLTSASVAGSNNCAIGSSDSLCTTIVPIAALDLHQFATETTTTPGSTVHLTAVYTNTGQIPYNGISVTSPRADTSDDTIPTGDQVATSGTLIRNSTSLIWTGNIPVGGVVTITRTLIVQNPDPGNQRIAATLNSAAVGNNCPTGTTDPRCTFLITVLTPGLTITTTANAPATVAGGTVTYTVTVQNTGQTVSSGASFTDNLQGVLNDATFNANAQASSGTLSFTTPNLTWTGDLAVGATATITFSVTVLNPDPGDKTMVNSVSSTTVGNTCPPASGNSACTSTVAVLTPALTIVKTSSLSVVTLGSTVTYTVKVTNSGQTAYAAATFSDSLAGVLDDAVYNAGATTATAGTTGFSGGVLTWTGGLAVGAAATITYTVTANSPSTGDLLMSNTIVSSSTGSNCPSGGTDTRCTAVVAVVNNVTLTFLKTADVLSTVAGAVVHYTVTVTNSSASDITGANFTDPLAGIIDDATYDNNASATAGTVTYAGSTLSFTGTVPAGATVTVTYSVTVNSAVTGNQILTGTVTSTSNQVSNNCLSGSTGPRCTSTVPVAALLIQQNYTEATTTPGSVVHLTSTFTNTGKYAYQGISISSPSADAVDDAIPGGDQTASSGNLVLTSSAIIWTGDVPIGGTITVAGTLTVKNPDTGNRLLTGTLISAAPGNNCPSGGTDARCTARSTVLLPGLTITKSAGAATAMPGDTIGFTIAVRNTGQTPYSGAVVTDSLVGDLDDGTYNADAAATSGSVSFASSTLTFTGDLAVGATATITYSVTVKNPDPGDKSMVDSAVSDSVGSNCPAGNGAVACRSSVDVLTPALTIVKTADVTTANLGTTVRYTVTVTNSGQTPYAAATFDDSLASVVDDAGYNPAATTTTIGTVSLVTGTLHWTGALAPNDVAVISYTITVNSPDNGNRSLANTVVSTTAGNNCPAGGTDPRCTTTVPVTNSAAVTFTKTADVTSVVSSGSVHYSVSVANSSGSAVAAVTFSESLAGVLDDATYNSDAAAGSGTVGFANSTLTWTGTVPAGGTVTVTYSVTVNKPLTGNQLLTDTLVSSAPSSSNNCLAGSTDSRCTTTVPVASLTIAQHYTETSTTPGSLIHLTGTFTNTGQVAYTNISVSSPSADVVDDAAPTGNETATSGTLVLSPTAITWTGDIPVGATVTITGTLTVNNPDTGNRLITGALSSAAVGNNCPSGGTDPQCTASIAVLLPGLTISKSANTTSVLPGGTAGYTITIANTGQTPYTRAVVTDSMTGLVDDAAYNNDAVATSGSLSLSGSALTWTGDLALAASVTITYTATAFQPDTGDKIMVNVVSSTAVGSNCLPASGHPSCFVNVQVLTPALTIVSTADTASAVPGTRVTYTTVVSDTGQTAYTGAAFSAALSGLTDDATYNADASATSGTVSVTSGVLSWSGPLAIGASATITYSVTVNNPVTGDFRLRQTVTSTDLGNICPVGGSDPRCSTTIPIAGVRIVTLADVTTAKPTSVVTYTNTFTNTGQVPYSGLSINIDVSGAGDDASYNGDATATSGSITLAPDAPVVTWTGDLAVGATAVMTTSVTVNNPDLGDKQITSFLYTTAAGSNCPVGGNDPACLSTVTVLTPALTISTAASATAATPGSVVTYTITATNAGQSDYSAATIRDSLAGVRGDATYIGTASATRGRVTFVDPTVTWTGDLPVGQSVVISYTVRINNPDLGDKTLVDLLSSDEIGSSCPTGSSNAACRATVQVTVPALAIAIAADRTDTTPGASVGYTITISNTGQTVYNGATVTAHLVGALDDAAYPGGATSDIGAMTYTAPDLTWTGNLAIGATATVTYALLVVSPDPGDKVLTTTVTSPAAGSTCSDASPCANTVTVLIPGLAVSTSASTATATPGDRVTYTITMHNTGQTAYVGTSFSSSLAGIVDDATFDGSVESSVGVANYTAPVLTWTGALPVGATAVISYTVVVTSPDSGDKVMSATVVAPAVGSTCPAGSTNSSCTASVTVLVPALTISTSAGAPTTTPGSVVTFTVLITNSGQTAYTGAVVADSLQGLLADSVYSGNASASGGGALIYSGSTLTWTGDLPVAASATVTFSVTVANPDHGDKQMVNMVSSAAAGSSCPAGATGPCAATVTVLVPGLTISTTSDVVTVTAGNVVHYTVTLTNTGETAYAPATFTDPLPGVLDDARWDNTAAATSGTLSYTNNTLSWSGALARRASATITYSVTTLFPATGNRALTNAIVSPSAGSTCVTGAEAQCHTTVTVVIPALTIVKSADTSQIVAGGTVHYTIVATNTGQADYPAANLSDLLTDVTDDAVYNNDVSASVSAVSFSAGALQWSGALAQFASVTITYSVTVNVADTGNAVLVNRIVSTSTGSTCPAAGADPRCAVTTAISARSIGISGITPSFTLTGLPGITVTENRAVTMTVTTNSSSGYTVTVEPEQSTLIGSNAGNPDSIPMSELGVRDSGTSLFRALTKGTPLIVHSQNGPSGVNGDAVTNDFRIQVPFVNADTYSGTLDYIASTQ